MKTRIAVSSGVCSGAGTSPAEHTPRLAKPASPFCLHFSLLKPHLVPIFSLRGLFKPNFITVKQ
jgi:hypothetical protein